MNKHIAGRHFELTDAIKEYIYSALESLEKYNLNIISAHCIISGDTKNGKKGFSVEFVVNLKDKNTVVITQRDKDVYAAIDIAIERLKKSLRRYSDKLKEHSNISLKELESEREELEEQLDYLSDIDDDIVPMDLELHKPLDFEEARDMLKADEKRQFIVFNDNEGRLRVMYKRNDGKFGLY
jgi:putative sigma-54 modulation protein